VLKVLLVLKVLVLRFSRFWRSGYGLNWLRRGARTACARSAARGTPGTR